MEQAAKEFYNLLDRKLDYILKLEDTPGKERSAQAQQIEFKILKAYESENIGLLEAHEETIKSQAKAIRKHKDKILALEAICLIHGIHNINMFLAQGPGLIHTAADMISRREVLQPIAFHPEYYQRFFIVMDKPNALLEYEEAVNTLLNT